MGNLKERKIMVLAVENKKRFKIPGIGLQLDATGWCIVIMIIAAIVIGGIFALRTSAKVASTKLELGEIQTAVIQYEGLRTDGQPPSTLDALFSNPSIAASDAIDNVDHDPFLPQKARWAAGKVTDLWGKEYQYTVNADNTGTITSVGSGKSISVDF